MNAGRQRWHRLGCWAASALISGCGGAQASSPAPPQAREGPPAVASVALAGPIAAACRDVTAWHPALRDAADAAALAALARVEAQTGALSVQTRAVLQRDLRHELMWHLVRGLLLGANLHNHGFVDLPGVRTAAGTPLRLHRTGFTPSPGAIGSCVRALIEHGGVRHIVNLYAGPMPTADLEAAERASIAAVGGSYYTAREDASAQTWRENLHDDAAFAAAESAVARLIRHAVLRPGGEAPRGALHIHCGGGMHRTGMVVGVLQRCLGGASDATVEAAYRHHVGWRSDAEPGGFEQGNLDFIRRFRCELLQADTPTQAPAAGTGGAGAGP